MRTALLSPILLCACCLRADQITWTGTNGQDWNDPSNWDLNRVPTSSDQVWINSGTVILSTNATVGSLSLGGSLTLPGTYLRVNGPTVIATSGYLLVGFASIGTPLGGLSSLGPMTLDGTLTFAGPNLGGIDGTGAVVNIGVSGILNTAGGWIVGPVQNAGQLNIGGTTFWSGLTNLQSGVIELGGEVQGAVFYNAGTARANGDVRFSLPFFNSGTVDASAQNSWYEIRGSGYHTGVFLGTGYFGTGLSQTTNVFGPTSLVEGGFINFNDYVKFLGTLNSTTRVSFSGITEFSGTNTLTAAPVTIVSGTGIFDSGRPVSISNLEIDGGVLTGTDPVTVTGNAYLHAVTISNCNLFLAGQTTMGGAHLLAGSSVNNLPGASITMTNYTGFSSLDGSGHVYNSGLVTCCGGYIGLISNAPGGVIEFPCDAENVGGLINAGLVRKTAGSGTNTIPGDFFNSGTLEVDSGTLAVGSNFTQTSTGFIALQLGGKAPSTGFNQLVVSGQANLAGTLKITDVNGFVPSPGDQFPVLLFGSRTGDFDQFDDATGNGLTRVYDSASLTLAVPQNPSLIVEQVGGQIQISWPPAFSSFVLQSNTNLLSTNWVDITSSGSNSVVITPSQPATFFRLRSP